MDAKKAIAAKNMAAAQLAIGLRLVVEKTWTGKPRLTKKQFWYSVGVCDACRILSGIDDEFASDFISVTLESVFGEKSINKHFEDAENDQTLYAPYITGGAKKMLLSFYSGGDEGQALICEPDASVEDLDIDGLDRKIEKYRSKWAAEGRPVEELDEEPEIEILEGKGGDDQVTLPLGLDQVSTEKIPHPAKKNNQNKKNTPTKSKSTAKPPRDAKKTSIVIPETEKPDSKKKPSIEMPEAAKADAKKKDPRRAIPVDELIDALEWRGCDVTEEKNFSGKAYYRIRKPDGGETERLTIGEFRDYASGLIEEIPAAKSKPIRSKRKKQQEKDVQTKNAKTEAEKKVAAQEWIEKREREEKEEGSVGKLLLWLLAIIVCIIYWLP